MVELIANLRDVGYYNDFPEANRLVHSLEAHLISMLHGGAPTDDLEQISDAAEEAGALLSADVITALRSAIESEIDDALQRAAETDSESTLEERIGSLSKLAPRANVPSSKLEKAIDAINDRIRAIEEEAVKEDGPDFTSPKAEVDAFDDNQLRGLFATLLTDD